MAGMQQSEVSATRNGITALEMAFSGIRNCRSDVENTKFNLSSGYKGTDGHAFQGLVTAWEQQCDVILKNLEEVINTLNETLRQQGLQQGSANQKIEQEYQKSQAIFDALAG